MCPCSMYCNPNPLKGIDYLGEYIGDYYRGHGGILSVSIAHMYVRIP